MKASKLCKNISNFLIKRALIAVVILFACAGVWGANLFWVGGTTGNWNVASNWNTKLDRSGNSAVPGADDNAILYFYGGAATTITVDTDVSVNGILVCGSTCTLKSDEGNTRTLNANIMFVGSSGEDWRGNTTNSGNTYAISGLGGSITTNRRGDIAFESINVNIKEIDTSSWTESGKNTITIKNGAKLSVSEHWQTGGERDTGDGADRAEIIIPSDSNGQLEISGTKVGAGTDAIVSEVHKLAENGKAVSDNTLFIWTGEGADSTLTTTANWKPGFVPNFANLPNNLEIIINQNSDDNYPNITNTGGETIKSIIVQSGASVTMASGVTSNITSLSLKNGSTAKITGDYVGAPAFIKEPSGTDETATLEVSGKLSINNEFIKNKLNIKCDTLEVRNAFKSKTIQIESTSSFYPSAGANAWFVAETITFGGNVDINAPGGAGIPLVGNIKTKNDSNILVEVITGVLNHSNTDGFGDWSEHATVVLNNDTTLSMAKASSEYPIQVKFSASNVYIAGSGKIKSFTEDAGFSGNIHFGNDGQNGGQYYKDEIELCDSLEFSTTGTLYFDKTLKSLGGYKTLTINGNLVNRSEQLDDLEIDFIFNSSTSIGIENNGKILTFRNVTFKDDAKIKDSFKFNDFKAEGLNNKTLTINGTQTVNGELVLSGTDATSRLTVTSGSTGSFNITGEQTSGSFLEIVSDASNPKVSLNNKYYADGSIFSTTPSNTGNWELNSDICLYWTGKASSDDDKTKWEIPANWSKNRIPGTTDKILIKTVTSRNYPVINSTVEIDSLELQGDGEVSVAANQSLTINSNYYEYNEKITGDGKLIIPSAKAVTVTGDKTVGINIENNGSLTLGSGTVIFEKAYSGTGSFTASSGITEFLNNVDFENSTGFTHSSGTVRFFNKSATKTSPITFKTKAAQAFNNVDYGGDVTFTINGNCTVTTLQQQAPSADYYVGYNHTATLEGSGTLKATSYELYRISSTADIVATTEINTNLTITYDITVHSGTNIIISNGKEIISNSFISSEDDTPATSITNNGTISVSTAFLYNTLNSVSNNGLIEATGTGTITAGAITGTGTGTLKIATGSITLNSTTQGSSQNKLIAAGGTISVGADAAGLTLTGSGTPAVELSGNNTITGHFNIKGNWTDTGTLTATGSHVEISDSATISVVSVGATYSFYKLTVASGKTVTISSRTTLSVNEAKFDGANINATTAGSQWTLDPADVNKISATNVTVKDSFSTKYLGATGTNNGNSFNWVDAVYTWKGGTSGNETDWNTAANWTVGTSTTPAAAPLTTTNYTDIIINTQTAGNDPVLPAGDLSFKTVTVNSGSVLDLKDQNLALQGSADTLFTNEGTVELYGTQNLPSTEKIKNDTGSTVIYYGGSIGNEKTAQLFGSSFVNLTVNQYSTLQLGDTSTTVSGTFSNEGTVEINGTGTFNPTTMDTDSGTIKYSGENTVVKDYGATDYYNLLISAGTAELSGDISAANKIDILSSSTLTADTTLITDSINVGATITDTASPSTHNLTILPANTNKTIYVGSDVTNEFSLSNTEIGNITVKNLKIGSTTCAGDIDIKESLAANCGLYLTTGGNLKQSQSGAAINTISGELHLEANGNIGVLSPSNPIEIGSVNGIVSAISSGTGDINLKVTNTPNSDKTILGGSGSQLQEIKTNNGSIQIITQNPIEIQGNITSSKSLSLDAQGSITEITGTLSTGSNTADYLNLTATTGIGTSTAPIEANSSKILANSTASGGVYINNYINNNAPADFTVSTQNEDIALKATGFIFTNTPSVNAGTGNITLSSYADNGAINLKSADFSKLKANTLNVGASGHTGNITLDTGSITLPYPVTFTGNILKIDSYIDANGKDITINTSSLDFSSGSYTNGGTLVFNNSNTTLTPKADGSTTFTNITIESEKKLTTSNNSRIKLTGDWTNEGTFTAGTDSTIQFAGTSEIKGSSITTFNNLIIDSGKTLKSSVTATDGNIIKISGNWTNNAGTSGFTPNSGTVQFTNTSEIRGETIFANFTASDLGGKTITLYNDVTVNGSLTLKGTEPASYLTVTDDGTGKGFILSASQPVNITDNAVGSYLKIGSTVKIKTPPVAPAVIPTSDGITGYFYKASNSVPSASTSNADYAIVINNGWRIKELSDLTYTWTGAAAASDNTKWEVRSNWDIGIVPGVTLAGQAKSSGATVIIPDGIASYPELNTISYTLKALTIGSSPAATPTATLSLAGSGNLEISTGAATGTLTNFSQIIYSSSGRIVGNDNKPINDSTNGSVEYKSATGTIADVTYNDLKITSGNWSNTSSKSVTVNKTLSVTGTPTITFGNGLTVNGGGITIPAGVNLTLGGTIKSPTNFTQTYGTPVSLSANADFQGSSVTFNNTVDGGVIFKVSANGEFNGNIGGTSAPSAIEVTGTTAINTAVIKSSGNQTYTGAVTIGEQDTTFTSTSGKVKFASTLTGTPTVAAGASSAYDVTISGNADFDGNVSNFKALSVTGTTDLAARKSISAEINNFTNTVTMGDDSKIAASTMTNFAGNISAAGNTITLDSPVTIKNDITLTAANVTFKNNISNTAANEKLTLIANTSFSGPADITANILNKGTINVPDASTPLVPQTAISFKGTYTSNDTTQPGSLIGSFTTDPYIDFYKDAVFGNFTANNDTVRFVDTSAKNFKPNSKIFADVIFDNGTTTIQENITADNLTIGTSGIVIATDNKTITINKNWENTPGNSGFIANESTVKFDSTNDSNISGDTTFYNLTCEKEGKTLTFEAGSTQTISNKLTITGKENQLIKLRSSNSGNQWKINCTKAHEALSPAFTLAYVDVQDSNNISAYRLKANSSTDSSNNTRWDFLGAYYTWTGTENNNWFNMNNWLEHSIPGLGTNIKIPVVSNHPILEHSLENDDSEYASLGGYGSIVVELNALFDLSHFSVTVKDVSNKGHVRLTGSQTITKETIKNEDGSTVEYYGNCSTMPFNGNETGKSNYYNLEFTSGASGTISSPITVENTTFFDIGDSNTLTLSEANTFTEKVTINSGKLNIASNGSLKIAENATATTLNITGGAVEILGNITTSGNQSFSATSPVTLAADATLDAATSTVKFVSTVNGSYALSIGTAENPTNAEFKGNLGAGTPIANLKVYGATILNTDSITTTGTQTYSGQVNLAKDITLTTSASPILFESKVEGAHSLNIKGNGNTTFNETVGLVNPLSKISIDGTTSVNTTTVKTTGNQTYTGKVIIGAQDTVFTSGTTTPAALNLITFKDKLSGNPANNLTFNANINFENTVSDFSALEITGTSSINADITTTDNQTYGGVVTLTGVNNLKFASSADKLIHFKNLLTGNSKDLTIESSYTTFDGNISLVNNLKIEGKTKINAVEISTIAAQIYEKEVTVLRNTQFTGTDITFKDDVSATDKTLTLINSALFKTSDGKSIFTGSLTQNGTGQNMLGGSLIATDNVNFATNVYLYGADTGTTEISATHFNIGENFVIGTVSSRKSILKNIEAENIVLYSGDVEVLAETVSRKDVVLLGADYSVKDEVSNIENAYVYNQKRFAGDIPGAHINYRLGEALPFEFTFPDSTTIPSKAGVLTVTSGFLSAGENFYANGLSISGNIKISENIDSTVRFAEAYNCDVSASYISCNTSGENAKIACENCSIDDSSAQNGWNQDSLQIEEAYTVRDNTVFIKFNRPIRNKNGELNKIIEENMFSLSGAYKYDGIFTDADCENPVNKGTDLQSFYLRANAIWNTDATGSQAGSSVSTDRKGTHRNGVIPFIDIIRNNSQFHWTITDIYGKRIDNYNGTNKFTEVLDHTGPVLYAVRTGQEKHVASTGDASEQHSYDSHNFIEFRYSEPVVFNGTADDILLNTDSIDASKFVENVQVTDSFGAVAGDISRSGTLKIAGLGEIENGLLYTGKTGSANKYVNALYRLDDYSIRLSLAGYTDGDITDTNGNSYKNWIGYIEKAELPSGKVNFVIHPGTENTFVKDINGNNQERYKKDDDNTVPTVNHSSFVPAGASTKWDLSSPTFALYRLQKNIRWTEQAFEKFYESESLGNNAGVGSTLDRIEFHLYDNQPDFAPSAPEWFTEIGWCKPGSEGIKPADLYNSDTYAADIFGGSNQFTLDSSKNPTGGIRYSSVMNASGAFMYALDFVHDESKIVNKFDTTKKTYMGAGSFVFSGASNPRRASNDKEGLYFGIPLKETNYDVTQSFTIKYDENKGFVTDLAGNRLRTSYIQTIDRTPPSFDISVCPVGQDEIELVFVKELNSELFIKKNNGEFVVFTESYEELLPQCFDIIEIDSAGYSSVSTDLKIDTTVPARISVVENENNSKFTHVKLKLSRPVTLEDIEKLHIRVSYSEKYGETFTDLFTDHSGSKVSFIQDKGRNYVPMYTAHALSDFAVGVINPLYAYNSDFVEDNGNIVSDGLWNNNGENSSWAVHDWNRDQQNYGTLPEGVPIAVVADVTDGTEDNINAPIKVRMYASDSPDKEAVSVQINKDLALNPAWRIWLPAVTNDVFTTIAEKNNRTYDSIDSEPLSERSDSRLIFNIDTSVTEKWSSGSQISFLFGLLDDNNKEVQIIHSPEIDINIEPTKERTVYLSSSVKSPLYAVRQLVPDDFLSLDLWSFRLKAQFGQRGGATILNNVINATVGEKAVVKVNLAKEGRLNVFVMTLDGNIVQYLNRGQTSKGEHYYTWDGTNRSGDVVARGMYFVRIVGDGIDETRKIMVVKE